MYSLCRSAACAVLIFLAANLSAGDWDEPENAHKAGAKLDKPVFLAVKASVGYGMLDDAAFDKLKARAESDKDAQSFVTASVNVAVLSMNPNGEGYVINQELVDRYGAQGTCSVYAPGASEPLWSLTGGLHKEDVFRQAKEAYDAWRKTVDDIEAEIKENKDLKKDVDTLLKLSEAWAAGKVGKAAVENLDDALKLIKKADKSDARIESLTLRRAQIQLDCGLYAEADKSFGAFQKDYKDSASVPQARLGQAKAMIGQGLKEQALKELRLLRGDKAAADTHKDADELIKKLEKDLESK